MFCFIKCTVLRCVDGEERTSFAASYGFSLEAFSVIMSSQEQNWFCCFGVTASRCNCLRMTQDTRAALPSREAHLSYFQWDMFLPKYTVYKSRCKFMSMYTFSSKLMHCNEHAARNDHKSQEHSCFVLLEIHMLEFPVKVGRTDDLKTDEILFPSSPV